MSDMSESLDTQLARLKLRRRRAEEERAAFLRSRPYLKQPRRQLGWKREYLTTTRRNWELRVTRPTAVAAAGGTTDTTDTAHTTGPVVLVPLAPPVGEWNAWGRKPAPLEAVAGRAAAWAVATQDPAANARAEPVTPVLYSPGSMVPCVHRSRYNTL